MHGQRAALLEHRYILRSTIVSVYCFVICILINSSSQLLTIVLLSLQQECNQLRKIKVGRDGMGVVLIKAINKHYDNILYFEKIAHNSYLERCACSCMDC